MSGTKTPPDVTIKAGYNMTKAKLNWPDGEYLGKAIDLVKKAIKWHVENDGVFYMQGDEALYYLMEAAHAQIQHKAGRTTDAYRLDQGKYAIGRAHNSLRLVLNDLGYRDITNEDFARFGDGGGR
jgi:hypothetical protein